MDRRIIPKTVDMTDEEFTFVQTTAMEAVEKCGDRESQIAAYIKRAMDRVHYPCWNCIVGRSFYSWVTHESKKFAYFYVGPFAVLLWKYG